MSATATDQGLTLTGDALADVRAARDLASTWVLECTIELDLTEFAERFNEVRAFVSASTAIGFHSPTSNVLSRSEVDALRGPLTELRDCYRGTSPGEEGLQETLAAITRGLVHLEAAA